MPGSRFALPNLSLLLWILTGIIVTALSLRFGMRAVGVRDELVVPNLIYSLTAPLVAPFYHFFPVSSRFDYPVVEVAALVASGVVITLALAVYMVGLLLSERITRSRGSDGADK